MPQKQYRLWTPIANAFEAYRRRLVAEPKAVYEHVWRLIHIHESLIVTLGAGLASRLLSLWTRSNPACAEANRLRREVTGLAVPGVAELDDDLAKGDPSCLEGFIKPWINLLKDFAKDAAQTDCAFCKSLATYLMEKPAQPLAFLEPWKRVAEIPQVFIGELSRIDRFDAINTLRNKLAHVPVPHRILQDLHLGLRQELLSLLAQDYKPQNDSPSRDYETTKWHEPLRGRIVCGSFVLAGSSFIQEYTQLQDPACIYFEAQSLDDKPDDRWCVSPFVRVDEELKVSLLFLLNDIRTDPSSGEFRGEYHRFAAEIQPVQKETVPRAMVHNWIPVAAPRQPALAAAPPSDDGPVPPQPSVVSPPPEEVVENLQDLTDHQLRRVGDDAFRVREYRKAAEAFDLLAQRNGDTLEYNDVAKSKHGSSLWRIAEEPPCDGGEKERLIRRAINLLGEASGHRDPRYQARALYEKSKALWHLWRHLDDPSILKQALDTADEAARLQNEPSIISWYEKVANDLERAAPSVASAVPHDNSGLTNG